MLGSTFKMELLVLLLLGTIAMTTRANKYIVNKFEINSTKGPLSHMVLDKKTGNIYAGAMNNLYQLSSQLTLIKTVTTGPEYDNPNCPPQNINASCDQPKTAMNAYSKALVIDYNNNTLIACSNLYHGICERYNLSDIDSKDPDIYVPVVANNASSTTLAFIAPGPLNGIFQSDVLYVAASRNNDGQSIFRDLVPALASRNLETFDLFYKDINTSSSKSVQAMHRDTFPVDYIHGFSSNNFSYFVTVQKQNPTTESYISKLIRVCQADKHYYSYAEVQLKCMHNGALYNLVQAAYVAKAGRKLAKAMNIREDEDVLYGVCSIGNPNTSIPGSDSALCIYPLRTVRMIFTENIKACFNGIGNTGPSHIVTEVACQKKDSPFHIDDDYCGNYGINTPIDGQTPIQTEAAITFKTTVSAVVVTTEENDTIAFVGTVNGHIIKVLIESREEATAINDIAVEVGNKINADMIFNSDKENMYVLTDTKIFKLNVEGCKLYKTCASCVGDPDCGWWHTKKWCDRWSKHSSYKRSTHLCTSPVYVSPDSIQKGGQQTIHLEFSSFDLDSDDIDYGSGSGMNSLSEEYECKFSSGNISIKTHASETGYMTFTCNTPPSIQLPPIQTGEDHIVMNLSLLGDEAILFDTNFTFFDCNIHISCTSCTQSNFPCTWCINNHTCTFDISGCPDNKLVLGKTVKQTGLTSHNKGHQSCPRIQSNETEIIVPSEMDKKIVVTAFNLMDFQTSLLCFFDLNNGKQVNAKVTRLPNSESIIECELVHFSYLGNATDMTVPFYISWALNKSLDNPDKIQVIMYKCEIALSCGGCLILKNLYECGWCEKYCTIKSRCSSMWISTAETCPNPEIININPTSGPMGGGTYLTIKGINLGKSVEDINSSVYIENRTQVQCTPVKDLYIAPEQIVCVTGASSSIGIGKLVVTISSHYNATTNHITFSYLNPVIGRISPSRGPKSGGSLVTLSGYGMNAGSNRRVWIGNHSCEVKSFNSTMLTCVTSMASDIKVEKLRAQFDNQMVTSGITYEYTTDPTIIKIDPRLAIVSGGILIDVRGTQLDIIQEPKMVLWYGFEKFEGDCKTENSTLMRCYSPQVEVLKSSGNVTLDKKELYSYGFILDSVTEILNLTNKGKKKFGKFRIVPDPTFQSLTRNLDNIYLYVPDNDLIINAQHMSGVSERDVTVKIGNGLCTDISVATLQVICKPPKDQPKSLNGSTNPEVIVCVGRNFSKLVGYLRYQLGYLRHQREVPLPTIIGVTVGVVVLCIMIFVVILIIMKKREKNRMKKCRIQMDILESKVAKECKEDNTVTSGAGGPFIDKSTLSVLKDAKLIINGNRLRLGDIIGKGHFGCVFKGYLTLPRDKVDILVAIKTLHKKNLRDIDVDAFLREIMIMKEFHHPNVLRLLGICLGLNDIPLMVLPFMEHGDLLSYIRNDINTPTVEDLVHFGIGIAEGMAYLSGRKFVHRDLAARNCMLDKELNVKVADFGLTREIYEKEYYGSDNKKTKLPIRWMAPESMEKGTYSSKSDVWSYGIVLWELVTRGVTPYSEVDNWDIWRYLQKGRRLPQPQYCPDKVYDIMQKCWLIDPQDRPTFSVLAREITHMMSVAEHDMQQGLLKIDIRCAQFNQVDSAKYHYAHDDTYLEPPTKTEPIGGDNSGNDYMEVFDHTNDVQIYPMAGANGNNTNELYHYAYDDTYLEPATKTEPLGGANSGNDYMEVFDDTSDVQIYPMGGVNGNKKNEAYHDVYDDSNLEPPTKADPADGATNNYMDEYPTNGANSNNKHEPLHNKIVSLDGDAPGKLPEST